MPSQKRPHTHGVVRKGWAPTVENTTLKTWEERDRLHIGLTRKSDGGTVIDLWDDAARQAIEDGFVVASKGKAAMHKSLVEYCNHIGIGGKGGKGLDGVNVSDGISNITYGRPGNIIFTFRGQKYSMKEPADVLLVGLPAKQQAAARAYCAKQILDGKAKPIAGLDGCIGCLEGSTKRTPRVDGRRDDDIDRSYEGQIRGAMARAFYVTAWADSEEEKGRSFSGKELMDEAPPTPTFAHQHATKFMLDLERMNKKHIADLFIDALEADGVTPRPYDNDLMQLARNFGHYLAMQAMGHGVSWFDDHKKFPIKIPHDDDGVRAELGGLEGAPNRYIAYFQAQEWQGDYAVDVNDGVERWDATEFIAKLPATIKKDIVKVTGGGGRWLDKKDSLADDPMMPEWSRAWEGPYSITVVKASSRSGLGGLEGVAGGEAFRVGDPVIIASENPKRSVEYEGDVGVVTKIDPKNDRCEVLVNRGGSKRGPIWYSNVYLHHACAACGGAGKRDAGRRDTRGKAIQKTCEVCQGTGEEQE